MDADSKPCPVCGETIKTIALKCRFCNTDLETFAAKQEHDIEKPLFSGHPAIIYSLGQFVSFVVVLFLAVFVGYNLESWPDRLYLILVLVSVCGFIYLYFLLKSLNTQFTITTQRIKVRRGILSQKEESLELFRIDHFEMRKPLMWRLMGNAGLHLYSSDAELSNFYIYAIPQLESLAEKLRECQLRERTRRGLTTFVKA